MSERRKTDYEGARLEILIIKAEDVISTSGGFTDHVDKNADSWVTPGADSEWG